MCIFTRLDYVFYVILPIISLTYSLQELTPGYKIYWNADNANIQIEVHCQNLGWCAFSVSPEGGIKNNDLAVFWVENGQAHLSVSKYLCYNAD